MSFAKLKELIGDNAEAKAIIDNLEKSSNDNVSKINDLETKFNEAKNGRDSLKGLIRTATGLEEVTQESVDEFVTKLKSTKGDEKLTAEIDNLKGLLETANNDKKTLIADYEGKISNMALTNSLRDLGIGSLANSPISEQMILNHLKEGAILDGDNIVYKKADGTTEYLDSVPMTPQSKLNALKTNPDWMPLLKPDVVSGGGSQGNGDDGGGGSQTKAPVDQYKELGFN